MNIAHYPVLHKEVCSAMPSVGTHIAVDATLGEGGHSEMMLHLGYEVHAFERDIEILEIAKKRLSMHQNFYCYNTTYDNILEFLPTHILGRVSFMLFDLGVSMYHFKLANRGFSFRDDAMLDMRLGLNQKSAADVVNGYSENELIRVLQNYGEIHPKTAKSIAKTIVTERKNKPFETAKDLENVAWNNTMKSMRYEKLHPATLVFQAIRIEVNDELNILSSAMNSIKNILAVHGRLAIISYHSLEDRIVKNYLKENRKTKNKDGIFNFLNTGVITPSDAEIKENPASRSAKMRLVEYICGLE